MFFRRLACVARGYDFCVRADKHHRKGPGLRHALGLGDVLVVVEGQDDHVARLVKSKEVPRELPVDEVVPRLRLALRALHQPDLPVHEHGRRLERGLARERVRQVLLERAEP